MKTRHNVVSRLFLVLVIVGVLVSACGPTPMPTPTPTFTPLPTGTVRPTYTPTAVAMATEEATPAVEPATDTPEVGPTTKPTAAATAETGGTTREPSPTLPAETPTPAATRVAGPPPSLEGTLLFPIFDTNAQTYHIYRLNLASGAMEPFIRQASQPSVTPDGERVAWRSWQPDRRGLLSMPYDGGDYWVMIDLYEAARPDWAPDGEQFIFASTHLPDRQSRLYRFTGAGDPPYYEIQRNASPIVGRTPAFTPDGEKIVYQGCVENQCGLFIMNADGTNPLQLTEFKDDLAPAVSPDGTRVVYMSLLSGYWQVNVVNVDGSGRMALTDDWYWNGLPVWSPDGQHIIFVSTRDENWPDNFVPAENNRFRLWVMDADGGNQRPLNDFTFRLDGVPTGVSSDETAGWTQERLFWMER